MAGSGDMIIKAKRFNISSMKEFILEDIDSNKIDMVRIINWKVINKFNY